MNPCLGKVALPKLASLQGNWLITLPFRRRDSSQAVVFLRPYALPVLLCFLGDEYRTSATRDISTLPASCGCKHTIYSG